MKRKVLAVFMILVVMIASMTVNVSAAGIQITDISTVSHGTDGYSVTVAFSAPAGVSRVEMPTWTAANGQDDLVWHQAAVSGNSATCRISSAQHKNETGKYITHVYVYDRQGQFALKGIEVTVAGGAVSSVAVINSVGVTASNVSASGYDINVDVACSSMGSGLHEVRAAVWTEANGQDDIKWQTIRVNAEGNHYKGSLRVNTADHRNETGKYYTHVYAYSAPGKYVIGGTDISVSAAAQSGLSVTDKKITEVTAGGYRVTAVINAPAGISKVLMPTWTAANGQDDLIWHQASVSGNTAVFYVPVNAHKNESGKYFTHIYVYDKAGKTAVECLTADVPAGQTSAPQAPSVSNVQVTEVTAAGYRVTATVSAPSGIAKVEMPTWTEANGQDDLIWHQASVSGNTATFYVQSSAHKNEAGKYITHIYLYDKAGNKVIAPAGAVLPAPAGAKPSITAVNVSEVSAAGYRITAVINSPNGISKVTTASWTNANGQDDLKWKDASVSGNTATVYVPASEHYGSSGIYTTHVYVYDNAGNFVIGGTEVNIQTASGGSGTGVLSLDTPYITQLSPNGFYVTVKFNAPNGYSKIQAAVWTDANGQDDIIWHDLNVSGNTAGAYISTASHGNGHGVYACHVYLFDPSGKNVARAMWVPVP